MVDFRTKPVLWLFDDYENGYVMEPDYIAPPVDAGVRACFLAFDEMLKKYPLKFEPIADEI